MRVGNIYGSCLTETSEKRLDISIYIYISTKVELFGSPFFFTDRWHFRESFYFYSTCLRKATIKYLKSLSLVTSLINLFDTLDSMLGNKHFDLLFSKNICLGLKKSFYLLMSCSLPPKESIHFCRVEYSKLREARWKVGVAPHTPLSRNEAWSSLDQFNVGCGTSLLYL